MTETTSSTTHSNQASFPAGEVFNSKAFLLNLSSKPGVYRMLDKQSVVIYVGKAKNLKNRVASYFRASDSLTSKTLVMVRQIANIEITITNTEVEALLLENNLIKTLKPRYNILLKDDKSYPYIYLSTKDTFPRLAKHRGAKSLAGKYFGPYPNAKAVKDSLAFLQKIFPIRQCEDSYFKNRTRACLQYQIKRCSAPCIEHLNKQEFIAQYQLDVKHTKLFLEGKSGQLIDALVEKMDASSAKLEYESASIYRDKIISLRRIQEKQHINNEKGDLDVIAIAHQASIACIQIFFIRDGLNLGNKSFYPKNTKTEKTQDILNAFIVQYYLNSLQIQRTIPATILLNMPIADHYILDDIFKQQCKHKVSIVSKTRGERKKWIELAEKNAVNTLASRVTQGAKISQQFEALQQVLKLDKLPQRIECFDISHSSGEAPVASCVVFNHEGPAKADYRRFNIKNIVAGDDYAAMHQALMRRYKNSSDSANLPDILLIDGGKGQVKQAYKVLQELNIFSVLIVGITKGEGRRAELDSLFISKEIENSPFGLLSPIQGTVILPPNSSALHLTQQLRDEAHRFAITSHRQQRDKKRQRSELENIPGLGVKRRQLLLKQFGGLAEIKRSGIEDLSSLNGISQVLAQKIYDYFHP